MSHIIVRPEVDAHEADMQCCTEMSEQYGSTSSATMLSSFLKDAVYSRLGNWEIGGRTSLGICSLD